MSFRRICLGLAVLWLTAVAVAPVGAAAPQRAARPFGVQKPGRGGINESDRRLDVNNLNMWVTNYGSFAYDILTGNSGLVYPKGTTKTAVYASGLWLGCQVGAEVRVAIAEYSQEFGPGIVLPDGTPDNPNTSAYRVYKVVRNTGAVRLDGTLEDTSHVERAAEYPDDPLVHHSWSEYMAGAAPYGAPWKIYTMPYDDVVDPEDTTTVDVPGPDVLGDQMLWCVYNDLDPELHNNNAGSTTPLGVEVQQTTFAFNRQGPLGNTVFVKLKFVNKGTDTFTNMYASLWSDPDLGGASDDLVGCDVPLSLGFCYNATNDDQLYGASPPAVGYDFFQGPKDAGGVPLGMVSFNKYINGTDPGSFDETYNYMQGLLPSGDPLVDPITGLQTTYFHPGDPVTGSGWLDSNPADRRFLLSSGPFTMAPGEEQEVVGAIIIGQGKNRLSSVAALRFFDTFAQAAFDSSFNLPSPPAQPKVDVATDHGTVVLSWDAASRLNYSQPGYTFEGYNIYQGASVSGPWTLLATYDETTPPAVVFDEIFDVETGQIIPQFPVAFGSNLGVRFTHTITQDVVRGGNLRDGTEYYFAVTAYSYNAVGKPKVLENPQAAIRVIPQRGAGGTDYSTASATAVTYLEKDISKPPATDVISVEVVDPNLVTGHIYKVVFDPLTPPFSGQIGSDTATVINGWSWIDSTTGSVVLANQLNRRGDEDYRVMDGLRVKVTGKYFPKLQNALHLNNNEEHRRAIEGVNFGLPFFDGGASEGNDFLGSTINTVDHPDSFTTVEIRFSRTATQKAYRYLRLQKADGTAPANVGRLYQYSGYFDCNFQVWDAINNVQLDVAFLEKALALDDDGTLSPDSLPTMNHTWAPTDDALSDREFLFVLRRPYSDTPKDEFRVDDTLQNGGFPVLYTLTAKLRDASDVIDDGDVFEFLWANPATPNDLYVFDTAPLVRGNASLAKNNLQRIRAVPNPYYNRSRYELNQFSRVVRFINLPETCTIRIFNLAGELVRTLQKSDITSSLLSWDLQTDNQLPVASGIYIFHVDAGTAGSTFGRLVVFMEKERLNNY